MKLRFLGKGDHRNGKAQGGPEACPYLRAKFGATWQLVAKVGESKQEH